MIHAIFYCLYLAGGSSYMLEHPSADSHGYEYWKYDINQVRNPYGVAELGCSFDLKRFTVELAARHESSIPEGDYGQNTVEARVRFYPFRGP